MVKKSDEVFQKQKYDIFIAFIEAPRFTSTARQGPFFFCHAVKIIPNVFALS